MAKQKFLMVQVDYHRVEIPVDEIAYMTRENRKVKITMGDGSAIRTNQPMKDLFENLPEEDFLSVNRGVVVARKFMKSDVDGLITMTDGMELRWRVREPRTRKPRSLQPTNPEIEFPVEIFAQWMDTAPLAMCAVELQKGKSGAELLLRYCNRALEELEHIRFSDYRDRSLTEISGLATPQCLKVVADVAAYGSAQTVELSRDGRAWRMSCHRPLKHFCIAVFAEITQENRIIADMFGKAGHTGK